MNKENKTNNLTSKTLNKLGVGFKLKLSVFTVLTNMLIFQAQATGKELNKEFTATIGEKQKVSNLKLDSNGTITLSGKNSSNKSSNNDYNVLPKSNIESSVGNNNLNEAVSGINTKSNMTIEEALNSKDLMTFTGGKKNKNRNKESEDKIKTEVNNTEMTTEKIKDFENEVGNIGEKNEKTIVDFKNNSYSSAIKQFSFTDMVKEIPIPKDFSLLNGVNENSEKYSAMPTSTAPKGLPNFDFKVIVDDSDLRKMVKNLNKSLNKNNNSDIVKNVGNDEKEDLKTVFLNTVEKQWLEALRKESQIMMLSGLPMKILIVPSQDDLMYHFMKGTIGKVIDYKKIDDGIFSVLGKPFINGKQIPMCFIAFDDVIDEYNNKVLKPLENKIGKEATASLVVGHSVGLCLDDLERQNKVLKTNTWFSNVVDKIGIYSKSFQALYPLGLRSNLYNIKEKEILNNNAQKQYQQRIADSFGVMWAYNRGFKNVYKAFLDYKSDSNIKNYSIYNTKDAIKNLSQKLVYMETNKITLSKIWKIAREIQKATGVDKSLALINYSRVYEPEISDVRKEALIKSGKSTINDRVNLSDTNSMTNTNKALTQNSVNNVVDKTKKTIITKQNNSFNKTKNVNNLSTMNFNVEKMLKKGLSKEELNKLNDPNEVSKEVKVFDKVVENKKDLKNQENNLKLKANKSNKDKAKNISKSKSLNNKEQVLETKDKTDDKNYIKEKIDDNLRDEILFEMENKKLSVM